MFEFIVILCLASDPGTCRQLSKETDSCAADLRLLKEKLPIKETPDGEGDLVIEAFACLKKEKEKLKT